ncbi:tRNA lysidine(34) synthetase TilS [Luteibacter sahnii]|uniref:tRNA lysidine(34) synthetase TilS n=1 Tax=Luteibacter sahnii TaxID=3021977 RepID=UPI002A6AEC39|nr:tRNA lysidine(34) synthetase TilS [Luteibacter sp. PPL193]MDY1548197.1 tRNA lysidine(34) synthetase TilS [Luteibacter sp. PPL193]
MSQTLSAHLIATFENDPLTPVVVAYSGGPDSTALLHALATLPRRPPLRALHVDHGLQAESASWAAHCRRFCEDLDVPLAVVRVSVDLSRGDGTESAARRARRAAFVGHVRPGERLVLAHHRDDQMETVLLKLLRGAGPEGLGGMRERRSLGAGEQWRPVLDLPREALLAHVARHALDTVHDPSNDDPRVARAVLRARVMPALAGLWPQAARSIVHSARLCRDAADTLEGAWAPRLTALTRADGSLDAAGWLGLPPALRIPLLDRWLHDAGRDAPTSAQREALERQIREAALDRLPQMGWLGTEVRLWRGRLWAMPRAEPFDAAWEIPWRGEPVALPGGGTLTLDAARLPQPVTVRYRRGGETLRPAGDRHTRELRDLFQRDGVPPWERPRIPLIHDPDGRLIAVGDRWFTAEAEALFDAAGARPAWRR